MYIGSPSIAVLPNGGYVASHVWFGQDAKTGLNRNLPIERYVFFRNPVVSKQNFALSQRIKSSSYP